MCSVRLLVVDDQELVRAGISELCRRLPIVESVVEVADGSAVVEATRNHTPDIVLMDVVLRGLNGIDATAQLRRECPEARVIILSAHSGERWVMGALRAGAAGYILRDSSFHELELAFRAVLQGEIYLTPAVSRQMVQRYMQVTVAAPGTCGTLTARQCEILKLIAEGNSSKGIAAKLGLSSKTVDTHRAQIMNRLGMRDVPSLVRYAVRMGLVSDES